MDDADIDIERVHRLEKGEAVMVKLLSYKHKTRILQNTTKLRSSDVYKDVVVKEDFSLDVRKKREGLRSTSKQLYNAGMRPRMRFDKLIADNGVFIYDIININNQVIRLRHCHTRR